MHILTKILVVLVALLVVALVPLAAVSSTNQIAFKQKAADADAALKTLQADSSAAKDSYNASMVALQSRIASLEKQLATSAQAADAERAARADFEKQTESLKIQLAEVQGQVSAFAANDGLQTKLIDAMRQDIENARTQYLAAEKARVELQDAVTRIQGDLESETAAKRQLQEQLRKVTDEKDRASADLARYAALHGSMTAQAGTTADVSLPVPADRSLSGSVVSVKKEPDATLVEISVGSRDGVKEGWVMALVDGNTFVGNLQITKVDVNRSAGVVSLLEHTGAEVKVGQRAIARKGE
ncbi:MAG: hypothetical protein U0636_03080 [Phycisphaerales bacterium]